MERRKIVKIAEWRYQILKPRVDRTGDSWHDYGENKGIKAISDLMAKSPPEFDLVIDTGILWDVERYRNKRRAKEIKYTSPGRLENSL